jgi:hypothetical protein
MDIRTEVEATVSKGMGVMGAGTGTSVFGMVIDNQLLALLGLVITFLGFIVNFIFKFREDQRKAEIHRLKVATIRERDEE